MRKSRAPSLPKLVFVVSGRAGLDLTTLLSPLLNAFSRSRFAPTTVTGLPSPRALPPPWLGWAFVTSLGAGVPYSGSGVPWGSRTGHALDQASYL